ncbi:MAG: hypothetical protein WCA12_19970 [Burkholderiales bacterium]
MPSQFSWVDQQLVRGGFIERCDPPAAALYLFLVTVADAQGLSYYGEASLCRHLQLSGAQLCCSRDRLIRIELIAFQAPIYQVLALPSASASTTATRASVAAAPADRAQALAHLQRLREQLGGGRG